MRVGRKGDTDLRINMKNVSSNHLTVERPSARGGLPVLRDTSSNGSFLDGAPPYLVAIAHPSAVLAEIVECRHGLLSFQIEQFSENLRFILEHCAVSGRDCAFTTASQLAALIGKGELL